MTYHPIDVERRVLLALRALGVSHQAFYDANGAMEDIAVSYGGRHLSIHLDHRRGAVTVTDWLQPPHRRRYTISIRAELAHGEIAFQSAFDTLAREGEESNDE
jgi:hypothetical protein